MSTEEFNFWSLIVNSVIAIGTLAAVITALYLGLRQNKPRIKIFCGLKRILRHPAISSDQLFVYISATNAGVVDEYISTFGYRVGIPFSRKNCVVNPSGNMLEPTFPATVNPGCLCSDFIEIERFDKLQLDFFIRGIQEAKMPKWVKSKSWFPAMILRTARCWVFPNRANKAYTGKLEPDLVDHILEAYNSRTLNSANP